MSSKLRWHLGHLDSLRGIAVVGVVLVHSAFVQQGTVLLDIPARLQQIAMTGQRGVQLFFIVSAFTLFLSYDNRRSEHRPTLNFFVRRFFRLAPMFYIAIVLTYFLLPQLVGTGRDIALSLFFMHGLSSKAIVQGAVGGWSVADEALFYVCLPLLFSKIQSLKAALAWLIVAAPSAYFSSIYLADRFPGQVEFIQFFAFPVEFPVFLLGIIGYFIWKEMVAGLDETSQQRRKEISLMLLIVSVVLYKTLLPFINKTLYQSSLVCLLLLISLSVYPWRVLVNRYTQFMGKISYSVYLLHFFIFLRIQPMLANESLKHPFFAIPLVRFWFCFFGTLLITIPLASLAWFWIEEPGIAAGRRLIAKLEGRALEKKSRKLVPPLLAITGDGNSPDAQF